MMGKEAANMDLDDRPDRDPLTRRSAAAHDRARTILEGSDAATMDAVVWLSAHLSAMEHVVYPAMTASLTDQTELARQRALTRRLYSRLRLLERRCAGDGQIAGRRVEDLRDRLLATMDTNAALEHALLDRLRGTLGDEATASLATRYDDALRRGPTRPHPHGPHRGRLGRLTYTLDALRDHVLDVLDSRDLPLPQSVLSPREVGLWGRYLLGGIQARQLPPVVGPPPATDPRRRGGGNDD